MVCQQLFRQFLVSCSLITTTAVHSSPQQLFILYYERDLQIIQIPAVWGDYGSRDVKTPSRRQCAAKEMLLHQQVDGTQWKWKFGGQTQAWHMIRHSRRYLLNIWHISIRSQTNYPRLPRPLGEPVEPPMGKIAVVSQLTVGYSTLGELGFQVEGGRKAPCRIQYEETIDTLQLMQKSLMLGKSVLRDAFKPVHEIVYPC